MVFAEFLDRNPGAAATPIREAVSRLSLALRKVDWSKVGIIIAIGTFAIAAAVLYRTLESVKWPEIRSAVQGISSLELAGAFAATAASYLSLAGYDILALRIVKARKVPLAFAAMTSFISHSFTFMLGFGVLTGGAIRLRLYRVQGLATARILAAGALCALGFWMGLAALAGFCLVIQPGIIAPVGGLSWAINVAAGISILAALAAWIAFSAIKPRAIMIAGLPLRLPSASASLTSLAISIADTTFAALALWLLIPDIASISFPGFLIIFILATVLGVISHVPGGLGVFEAVILLGLPDLHLAQAVGSLLLFRLIYYVAPFALAVTILAGHELQARAGVLSTAQQAFARAARPTLAPAAAVAVFLGGVVLLVSGALPAMPPRIALLRQIVPLPFVETSHFVASLVGAMLLVVGYGLLRRLRSAWRLSMALLAAGAIFSLVKGVDFEEAIVCTIVMGLLWLARPEFYRRAGLLETQPSNEWLLAIAIAIGASLWVGLTVYSHVDYANSLWWDFAYKGDAPRFLRASLGIAITAVIFILYKFTHQAHGGEETIGTDQFERIKPIMADSARTDVQLALLGDKRFLISDEADGFVMYGVEGSTWLAMGDPVAPDERRAADLIWRFKELADLHHGVPAFYQISAKYIPAYIDAGFSLAKLGEDAYVDLAGFTLEGSEGRKLRQSKAHAERNGLSFEIIPAERVPSILPLLKDVSDAWLASRRSKEKGFSLGFWSDPYLSLYDHAVVRQDGRFVAFANIWKGAGKSEYSVDLMRYLPDAPGGTMDYLFICLLDTAKAEGFQWFNLGMAPLSGLPRHYLASRWSRLGSLIYRHGDRFYNFEGLRAFKSKFKPEWRPRYLAHPGGLSVAGVLVDAAALVAASPQRARKYGETVCA